MAFFSAFTRRLAVFLVVVAQTPLTHDSAGTPISALQVLARQMNDELKKGGKENNAHLRTAILTLLFPGNYLKEAMAAPPDGGLNVTDVWERGLQIATKDTDGLKQLQQPEMLLAGSWCLMFGSMLSLVLRRTHILQLFGVSLVGATIFANTLFPTVQFAVVALITGVDMVARGRRALPGKELLNPPAATPTATPRARKTAKAD